MARPPTPDAQFEGVQMPGPVDTIAHGLPLTWPRGAIDWRALMARYPANLRCSSEAEIERLRGRIVYLASPISHYLEIGQPDIAINHALDHAAPLLCRGVSPVSPVLNHLTVQAMRPDDEIAQALNEMPRDWWLRRCEPLLAASAAMAITPCPGWPDSDGVWAEANWMLERGRTVLLPGPARASEAPPDADPGPGAPP